MKINAPTLHPSHPFPYGQVISFFSLHSLFDITLLSTKGKLDYQARNGLSTHHIPRVKQRFSPRKFPSSFILIFTVKLSGENYHLLFLNKVSKYTLFKTRKPTPKYRAIYTKIPCNLHQDTVQSTPRYSAIYRGIPCNLHQDTVQSTPRYSAIFLS